MANHLARWLGGAVHVCNGSSWLCQSLSALDWYLSINILNELSWVLLIASGLGKAEARLKFTVVNAVLDKLTSHGKHEIHGFRIIHCMDIV